VQILKIVVFTINSLRASGHKSWKFCIYIADQPIFWNTRF